MQLRSLCIALTSVAACAQGSLETQESLGFTQSGTNVTTTASSGGDDDDEESSSAIGESTAVGETGDASSSGAAETATASDESTSTSAAESSSSGAVVEESSSGAPVTTMSEESSSDDGTPPPPDASAWGSCDAADCEAGNDCLNITGLREYLPYCAPTCVVDADCPAAPDGDAYIGCLASEEGEADPTNCVLVCEYDGEDYGSCPTGMTCAAVPGQTTPISLCMWP